jgi:hypothetical protein
MRSNELHSIPNLSFPIDNHSPIYHVAATSSEEQACSESKGPFPTATYLECKYGIKNTFKTVTLRDQTVLSNNVIRKAEVFLS